MTTLSKADLQKNVAANFRHTRKEPGKTSKQRGEMLGLPQKTYSSIEEGRSAQIHHVYRLSLLINVSLDTLFTTKLKA